MPPDPRLSFFRNLARQRTIAGSIDPPPEDIFRWANEPKEAAREFSHFRTRLEPSWDGESRVENDITIARLQPLDLGTKKDNNRATAALPSARKRKIDRRCRSEAILSARLDNRENRPIGNKFRRLGRTSRTILNLFGKLRILNRVTTNADSPSSCDKKVARNRDAGEAMSTRLTRGGIHKTPRGTSSKIGRAAKTRSSDVLETISYDYEAAVSQPDLTGFFKKEDNKNNSKDNDAAGKSASEKQCLPEVVQTKPEVSKVREDPAGTVKSTEEKVESCQSLIPKSELVEKKSSRKLAVTVKCPRTSRIPRARFTALSRLPLRSRGKKSSMTKLSSSKSRCGIVGEAPQALKAPGTTQTRDEEIEDQKSSNYKTSIVESVASKSVLSEEKCSGIEGDVELDADQEFTTSAEDSPGRKIATGDPSIAAVVRGSKLSCACHSCNDRSLEVSGHRVISDIWTDSRSSPEVGRYSSSGRNGRPKTRGFSDIAKNRGYPSDSTDESDTEPTTDFSVCETSKRKKTGSNQNRCDIPKPVAPFAKQSAVAGPAPRARPRARLRFSFFNTLFDIVFWPFLFLRPDR